jgi:pyruvate formate lyase activating enzyme
MTSSAAQRISCNCVESGRVPPEPEARIFNIQRFSLNDGQGIRTLIFFKGCPHRCPWCANPESISPRIQNVRRESKCLHCRHCLNDADECPSGAMERIGETIGLSALLERILKDEVFFRTSGGGVTLSGGEVLMQHDFARHLLQRLRALGIHTAIETAGDVPCEHLLRVAEHCDQILFDLKIMDITLARKILNMDQSRVLKNFAALAKRGALLLPRLPLIPGYTLDCDNFQAILNFLAPFQLPELHLLPFHQYGEDKYALLGKPYLMRHIPVPDTAEIARFQTVAIRAGYDVHIGG